MAAPVCLSREGVLLRLLAGVYCGDTLGGVMATAISGPAAVPKRPFDRDKMRQKLLRNRCRKHSKA